VGVGKTVTVTGLSIVGANAADYVLASTTIAGPVGTITPAPLTAALAGTVAKTYDTTAAATLGAANFILTGLIGSDAVTVANTAGTYDTIHVGTGKIVTVAGVALQGAQAVDYSLTATTVAGPVGTITPATVTAGLTGTVIKAYDTTAQATLTGANYNLSGVLGSDQVILDVPTAGTYDTSQVGAGKSVTVSNLAISGAQAADYVLTSTTAADPVGIITPATLTVTGAFTAASKTYDGTTTAAIQPGSSLVLAGVLGADGVDLSPLAAFADPNVGIGKLVTLAGSSLTGAAAGNYALSLAGAPTTTANITHAVLTVTADLTGTVAKVYDGTTLATLVPTNYALLGVITGDQVALNDPASGTYDTSQAGTAKIVTVTGLAISGAQAFDYTLTATSVSGPVGVITPATLTVAGAFVVGGRTYNGTTGAAIQPGAALALVGVVAGDGGGVSLDPLASFANPNVGVGKLVTLAGSTLTGADAGDYALSLVGGPTTAATITPAPLTITANSQSEAYLTVPAPLTATYAGLFGTGGVSGLTLSTPASAASPVGTYAIIPSGAVAPNYVITYVQGILTVTPSLTYTEAVPDALIGLEPLGPPQFDVGPLNPALIGVDVVGLTAMDTAALDAATLDATRARTGCRMSGGANDNVPLALTCKGPGAGRGRPIPQPATPVTRRDRRETRAVVGL
jgi:hypothetical protein